MQVRNNNFAYSGKSRSPGRRGATWLWVPAFAGALLSLSAPAPAHAQNELDDLYDRALAAGYKAQFLCSGLFDSNKTAEAIEADELTGIYERVQDIVTALEPVIDREGKRVSVAYDEAAPPRYALHNPVTGCTGMPIGWTPDMGSSLGEGMTRIATGALDDRPWPIGDRDAVRIRTQELKPIDLIAGGAFREGDGPFGSARYGGKTSAVVIAEGGEIVWEAYKPGHDMHTTQRTWSVAKSILGVYVGYAGLKGETMPDTAASLWPDPADPRHTIQLDQLMRMASGLYSDTPGNRTDPLYMGGTSARERATQWPLLRQPGSAFRYANNDILLAAMVARDAVPDVHPHMMFDALGMTRTFAETDWRGDYLLSSQVWTSARDLVRLGLLIADDGVWDHGEGGPERLLPEGWTGYMSMSTGPQPPGAFGYGATFWLMRGMEGIPDDAIAAQGNRGQYLVIIPSIDLIIVRRGYDTAQDRFDLEAFTRDVVGAVLEERVRSTGE